MTSRGGVAAIRSQSAPALDWDRVAEDLDAQGFAILPDLFAPEQCKSIAALYPDDAHFRSRIVMARHGFGKGEYKYFAYPLPRHVQALRSGLYPPLAEIANRWNMEMGIDVRYPPQHAAFLNRCHTAGQSRPTPLLLQYGAGDFNCLHQGSLRRARLSPPGSDPVVGARA